MRCLKALTDEVLLLSFTKTGGIYSTHFYRLVSLHDQQKSSAGRTFKDVNEAALVVYAGIWRLHGERRGWRSEVEEKTDA